MHPKSGKYLLLVSNQYVLLRKGKDLAKVWKESIRNITPELDINPMGVLMHLRKSNDNNSKNLVIPSTEAKQNLQIVDNMTKILNEINTKYSLIPSIDGETKQKQTGLKFKVKLVM